MINHKWYAINCNDCGTAVAYSSEPTNSCDIPTYCVHCAHSHAEVANWMMPIGSDYGTNGLYEVQTKMVPAIEKSIQFRKTWNWLFDKLEKYKIAKVNYKRNAK